MIASKKAESFKQYIHPSQEENTKIIVNAYLERGQLPALNLRNENVQAQNRTDQSHSYRPDIDGLRAIAIGSVLIFHAWPQSLPGGFTGVDIFFVISGYLITQILVKENMKNKFSYYNFYNRRVKRIYPALIVMLFFVLFIGTKFIDIQHFLMMIKTMAASTIFGANIEVLTYKEGYFDDSVKTNPLLHLWSLGVEQQFYIFWPFIITLMITKFRQKSFQMLTTFTILSFLFNVVSLHSSEKFDFYFPLSRFWQMAIGGLLAFKKITIENKNIVNLLSIAGLIGIVYSIFQISENDRYPGWLGLIPTFASAAIIQSGPDSVFSQTVLSNKIVVFIGKISYSLYLWHWPLLVFSRLMYPEGTQSVFSNIWLIVLIAVIISCVSYFKVQNPIRGRKQKSIFVTLLAIMMLIGLFCFCVYKNPNLVRSDTNQILVEEEQNFGENEEEQTLTNNIVKNATNSTSQEELKKKIIFEKYLKESKPTEEDYVYYNGQRIPNFSKNKNRLPSTLEKLQIIGDVNYPTRLALEKRIDNTSKYLTEVKFDVSAKFGKNFQIQNEGREKLVILFGDSHAYRVAFRFSELYRIAKLQKREHTLPTLILFSFNGMYYHPQQPELRKWFGRFIDKFKPIRIFIVYKWVNYQNIYKKGTKQPTKIHQKFFENIKAITQLIKSCTKKGVNVTVSGFEKWGLVYSPKNMFNFNGVIENNLKPFFENRTLTKAQIQEQEEAKYFNEEMKKLNVKVVDFDAHKCWEGVCHVTSPTGYPIFNDKDHWTFQSSRNWLTSVDFIIDP